MTRSSNVRSRLSFVQAGWYVRVVCRTIAFLYCSTKRREKFIVVEFILFVSIVEQLIKKFNTFLFSKHDFLTPVLVKMLLLYEFLFGELLYLIYELFKLVFLYICITITILLILKISK